jgi:hypothetical protein
MRHNGFLNTQLSDAQDKFGQGIGFKRIPADQNGGLLNYKEIDWVKLRKEKPGLADEVDSFIQERNKNNKNAISHMAADRLRRSLDHATSRINF